MQLHDSWISVGTSTDEKSLQLNLNLTVIQLQNCKSCKDRHIILQGNAVVEIAQILQNILAERTCYENRPWLHVK